MNPKRIQMTNLGVAVLGDSRADNNLIPLLLKKSSQGRFLRLNWTIVSGSTAARGRNVPSVVKLLLSSEIQQNRKLGQLMIPVRQ